MIMSTNKFAKQKESKVYQTLERLRAASSEKIWQKLAVR